MKEDYQAVLEANMVGNFKIVQQDKKITAVFLYPNP